MVGGGVLTPYLMKSPFFKFCQPPPFLLPPTPTLPALSVVLFLWLDGWSRYIICTILLNDIMDLQMPSVGTLVPEGPWCVFYATRRQVCRALTHNVAFCWYRDLISHTTHKHTQTHTAHSGASRCTRPYKYIFTPPYLCSQQLSLLYWMNNKNLFFRRSFLFKNYSLGGSNYVCNLS